MSLDDLIEQARTIQKEKYDSPKVDLWENRVNKFLESNYANDYLEMFDSAGRWNQIAANEQNAQKLNSESIYKAIEFLEELKSEPKNTEDLLLKRS